MSARDASSPSPRVSGDSKRQTADAPPERIYLVGFMGCGKTTVGRALAAALGWAFVDLDRAVEERAGLPVAEIFARSGEAHFRRLEFDALTRIALAEGPMVVALGGGAFVSEDNRAAVAGSGLSVWLDAPLRVVTRRIAGDKTERPLAARPDELASLYRAHIPFYREADVRVRTGAAPVERVVAAVVRSVRDDLPAVAKRRRLRLS